jgi:hypothetical protein
MSDARADYEIGVSEACATVLQVGKRRFLKIRGGAHS